MSVVAVLERRSPLFWLVAGFAVTGALGLLDYVTGIEIAMVLFYLAPVSAAAWFAGGGTGIAVSALAAAASLIADLAGGRVYSHVAIACWDGATRLAFFLVVTRLLTALHGALRRERALARTDHLTGAINARAFYEMVDSEITRSSRYERSFSLAYLDLDNFKAVNDRFGHSVGDEVLRVVTKLLRAHLRATDVVARLGGDEFAVLLPEADRHAAEKALEKVMAELVAEMERGRWPVTVSAGLVTCPGAPCSVDALVRRADELMYEVKNHGKHGVRSAVLDAGPRPPLETLRRTPAGVGER